MPPGSDAPASEILASLLDLPAEQMEQRGNHCVWSVTDEHGQRYIVKRFEQDARRQRLARLVRRHPAQRAVLWSRRLEEADLPVVPIAGQGIDAQERSWLARPYVGPSLDHWLRSADLGTGRRAHLTERRALSEQLAVMVGHMLRLRVEHGEFTAANLVIDDDGRLRILGTAAVRGCKGRPLLAMALRMLTTLHTTLQDAAAHHPRPTAARITRTERLRFVCQLERTFPRPVDGLQHLLRSREFG